MGAVMTQMKQSNMHRSTVVGAANYELDMPEPEPDDAKLQYQKKSHIKGPLTFDKQRSKRALLKDAVKHLNDRRFEVIHDISEWNGKFGSKIAQPFCKEARDTDIPGTVRNSNH